MGKQPHSFGSPLTGGPVTRRSVPAIISDASRPPSAGLTEARTPAAVSSITDASLAQSPGPGAIRSATVGGRCERWSNG